MSAPLYFVMLQVDPVGSYITTLLLALRGGSYKNRGTQNVDALALGYRYVARGCTSIGVTDVLVSGVQWRGCVFVWAAGALPTSDSRDRDCNKSSCCVLSCHCQLHPALAPALKLCSSLHRPDGGFCLQLACLNVQDCDSMALMLSNSGHARRGEGPLHEFVASIIKQQLECAPGQGPVHR